VSGLRPWSGGWRRKTRGAQTGPEALEKLPAALAWAPDHFIGADDPREMMVRKRFSTERSSRAHGRVRAPPHTSRGGSWLPVGMNTLRHWVRGIPLCRAAGPFTPVTKASFAKQAPRAGIPPIQPDGKRVECVPKGRLSRQLLGFVDGAGQGNALQGSPRRIKAASPNNVPRHQTDSRMASSGTATGPNSQVDSGPGRKRIEGVERVELVFGNSWSERPARKRLERGRQARSCVARG